MAEETYPEVSKKKSSPQDLLEYLSEWIPGVTELKEMKKRIEGKSEKKIKKETPWGEYE